MHLPSICKEITNYAFSKKCCNVNCIYSLVANNNIIKVSKAMQAARAHVYHINSNISHDELRYMLKSGLCRDT